MPLLQIQNLAKSYPAKVVFDGFNLKVTSGEFVTIFGPNGSGKSTLLNLICGLEKPGYGKISFSKNSNLSDKKDSLTPNSSQKELVTTKSLVPKVGFVFQNYLDSMLPWTTVFENIKFGLAGDYGKNLNSEQKTARVNQTLDLLGINHLKNHKFSDLSGGQKQIVAIARGLVIDPDILLLDEPFSNIDYGLTKKLQFQLLDIWQVQNQARKASGKPPLTVLMVSHDLEETALLGSRILIFSNSPVRILADIASPINPNKTIETLTSSEFENLKNTIFKAFISNYEDV